ncbi:phage tail protein [Lysinibacillus sp. BW-2-10]|uniref:phage tail protein n=1 Tax=Lysinibacillus sp. BW-2-10 TaxID=2590030 RepID=UPI0016424C79|nr:phage tail protein [Lysinibacillus sp. BW-2-10]
MTGVSPTLQISFGSFNFQGNVGHNLLDWEVIVEDEDGQEYKVKQYQQNGNSKSATATHIYFDLINTRQDSIFGGTHTIEEFLTFVFNGTGWTYTIDSDLNGQSAMIRNFGDANVIALVNIILSIFECERKILPGRVVQFGKVIGEDNDLQYRYKYNIADISKSIDTSSLKTQIRGYNSDRTIDITYKSPLANHPRIGIRVADPIETDDYTTVEEMTTFLATQIPGAIPEAIEVAVVEVDGEVGDYVWVIHEGIDLEYQTRILSKKTKRNYFDSTVTVGESTVKKIEDILVSQKAMIDQNNKVTRSKFEQTNERITLEVEEIGSSIATLKIRANSIESSVTDLNNNLSSTITQTAAAIRAEVTSVKSELESNISSLEITASQIQSTVSAQSTTIGNMQSQITQQAGLISSKVSQTDFTGSTIVSLIEQAPSYITMSAAKINFVGQVFGQGATFSGDIQTLNNVKVGNYIYLGDQYASNEKQIIFNNVARIVADWDNIEISAPRVSFYGSEVDFSGATVINLSASTVGPFSFAYLETGKLNVYRYGALLGKITLG